MIPTQPTDYQPTCPRCESTLYPIVLDPDSAPWFCARCRRAWWVAELRERAAYQPLRDDFGFGEGQWAIDRAVETERQEAHARGSSCRPDQLSLLSTQLGWLQNAGAVLEPGFHAQVVREATRHGQRETPPTPVMDGASDQAVLDAPPPQVSEGTASADHEETGDPEDQP
jgi:hypothetical protein